MKTVESLKFKVERKTGAGSFFLLALSFELSTFHFKLSAAVQ